MSDVHSRSIYHRYVTANDTPLITLAERTRLLGLHTLVTGPKLTDRLNGLVSVQAAENIQFGFYGIGDDGGTCIATIVGLPPILERLPETQAPNGPRPIRLAQLALTLGTSVETDLNPVTGESGYTGTWRAADTIVASISGTTILLLDAAGSNGAARAIIDTLRCTHLFCYISSLTNMTKAVVWLNRMETN